MVPLHRIELQITDYKTVVIPFNYKGLKTVVEETGIEPATYWLQTSRSPK